MTVDINNEKLYLPVRRKQHTVYACMPSKAKLLINHLVTPELARGYTNKVYDFDKAPMGLLTELENGNVSLTSTYYPIVLCNTRGVMRPASIEEVLWGYECETGELTLQRLQKGWVTLKANVYGKKPIKACFVPRNQTGVLTVGDKKMVYNNPLIAHGTGDFIVCESDATGKYDWGNRYVVNGLVFKDTFNNTGWVSEYLRAVNVPPVTIKDLQDICSNDNKVNEISNYSWQWLRGRVAGDPHCELILPPDWASVRTNRVNYTSYLTSMFVQAFESIKRTLPRDCVSCTVFVRNADDVLATIKLNVKSKDVEAKMLLSCHIGGLFERQEPVEGRLIIWHNYLDEDWSEIQRDRKILTLNVTTVSHSTRVKECLAKLIQECVDAARIIMKNGERCELC